MKTKKFKRIMSLFLAALMCVTTLVSFGTTAYAAEETVTGMTTTAENGDTTAMSL